MYAVFRKELADHLSSKRFAILFGLVLLSGIFAIYVASQNIRSEVTPLTELIFLKLFTTSGSNLPAYPFFVSLFIPLISIALGFDAVNSEKNSGNLSRLLSQPIYRDAVINGKFLSGLAVLTIIIVSMIAFVAGLGLRLIGVPPTSEEILRLIAFILISVTYGAFWLALSLLFSVYCDRASTSMLSSLALWIFFFLFTSMIAGAISTAQIPIDSNSSAEMIAQHYELSGMLSRISPSTLYGEATNALLMPELGSLNPAIMMISTYTDGRIFTSLSFSQSLLLIWPQLVSMISLAVACFAASYIKFMRQEIRSM